MSKIILAIATVFMIMAMGMLASAAADKESADVQVYTGTSANSEVTKEVALSETQAAKGNAGAVAAFAGQDKRKTETGKEYIIRAWGRSGPVSLSQGYTGWRRIYFGGYAFLGSPVVTDSLNIGGNRGAVYSLGTDAGYTTTTKFDARLTAYAGSISGSYIDWVATRG